MAVLIIIMDSLMVPIHLMGIIIVLPITPIHMARHIMVIHTSTRDMVSGIMVIGIEFSKYHEILTEMYGLIGDRHD